MKIDTRSPWTIVLLSSFYYCYWYSERHPFFTMQISDTYSDWLVVAVYKHLGTFKVLFTSPNKSFEKSSSECSAMHLHLGLWPSLCTHRRAKQGQAGRHAHSWKKELKIGRGSAVTVPGTILIQSSFCSIAHQKCLTERWSNGVAWQQAAVLLSGGSWARGHVKNCHRGSTSPDHFQIKRLCTTARTWDMGYVWGPKTEEGQ